MSAPSYIGASYSRPLRAATTARSVSPFGYEGRSLSPGPISLLSRNHSHSRIQPYAASSRYDTRTLVSHHDDTRGEHAVVVHSEQLDIRSPSEEASQTMSSRPDIETFRVEGPAFEPRRRKKARVANADRRAICLQSMTDKGITQEVLASRYGVERSTISKIVKEKDRWLSTEDQGNLPIAARHR